MVEGGEEQGVHSAIDDARRGSVDLRPENGSGKPSRTWRWLRGIALGLGGLFFVVLLGVLAALGTPWGRSAMCDLAADQVNQAIPGTLRIGRCASLWPWHLRLEALELFEPLQDGESALAERGARAGGSTDAVPPSTRSPSANAAPQSAAMPHTAPLASVGALDVRLRLLPLIRRRLHITALTVSEPRVSLATDAAGEVAVLGAVLAAEDAPATETPPAGSPWGFIVDSLALQNVRVVEPERQLALEVDDLGLGLRWLAKDGDDVGAVPSLSALRVKLGTLTARLLALGPASAASLAADSAGAPSGPAPPPNFAEALELVRVTHGEGRLAFGESEVSQLALALRSGESALDLKGEASLSMREDVLAVERATLTLSGAIEPYSKDTLLGRLERAGIWEGPLPLAVPLALSLNATIAESGLEGEAAVRSDAGDVVLTLTQPETSLDVELLLGTAEKPSPHGQVDLAPLLGGAPRAAGGRLVVRFTPQKPLFADGYLDLSAFREGGLSLRADGLRYDVYTLPSLRLEGALEAEAAVLSRLTLPYLRSKASADGRRTPGGEAAAGADEAPPPAAGAGAAVAQGAAPKGKAGAQLEPVTLRGRFGFDGALDLALRLNLPDLRRDPNWRALAPELRGGITGDVQVKRTADGLLDAKGTLALRTVHWGDVHGGQLDLQGEAAGTWPHLTGGVRLRGRDLRAGTLRLGDLRADVRATEGARWAYAAQVEGALTGSGPGEARFDLVADASLPPPPAQASTRNPLLGARLSSALNVDTPSGARYTLTLGRAQLESTALKRLPAPGTASQGATSGATSEGAEQGEASLQAFLSISDLKLTSGALRLQADANLDWPVPKAPSGRVALQVELRSAAALRRDLSAVLSLLGTELDLPEVTGQGQLELAIEGSLKRPLGRLALDLKDLRLADAPALNLESTVDLERRELAAHVEARLEDGGHLQLKGTVERKRPQLTWAALRAGRFDLYLTLRAFDLAALRPWRPAEEALTGIVEVDLAFGGTLREPGLQAELVLAGFHLNGRPPLSINLGAEVDGGESRFDLAVSDSAGPWAEGSAATSFPLTYALLDPVPDLLTQRDWRLALSTQPRGLGAITGNTASAGGVAAWPLSLAVKLGLRHTPRTATQAASLRGEVRVESAWQGSARAAVAELSERPDTCGSKAQPRAVVDVTLSEAHTELALRATLGDRELLRVEGESALPLLEWLQRGALPETLEGYPTVAALLTLHESELSEWPVVCEQAQGKVSGTVELTDLLSTQGRATADVRGRGMRVADSRAADVRLLGAIDSEGTSLELTVTRDANTLFKLKAGAPLSLRGAEVALGTGSLRGVLDIDDVPLPLLLSAVPNVREASGSVKGRLVFEGESLETLSAKGTLGFEDLSFALERPFMRIENVSGMLRFAEDHILIQQLRAKDYLGSLVLNGRVGLAGYAPEDVALELEARDYPLRTEGIVKAYLTGRVTVEGDLASTEVRTLDVTAYGLQVALPEERARKVRSLEPHSNVIFAGNSGSDTDLDGARALALHREAGRLSKSEIQAAIPIHVKVRTDTPFWLRRPEFALRLTLALDVHSRGPETRISGTVGIRRGFLQLMGRNFLFEEGEMRFSGGAEVDPNLDLTATYRLPSAAVVKLHVGGYLSEPILTFSSNDPALVTETDIIAAVLGFRSGPEQQTEAQAATRAALSGLVADLVGTVARREFGQFVPILMLESDGTLATSRVRAGLQADALIPKSWEKLVRGVYVEGVLGGDQRNEGVNAGFIIELFWPRSLSTRAGFRQPDNWSLDMLWEP